MDALVNKRIAKVIKGDQNAFAEIVELYQHQLYHICYRMLGNKQEAEDIAQEVFVEVFSSIANFKGQSKLSTWIYRITTNKCLEFIRKRNTKKRFAFLQSITGPDFEIDKTNYFTEMNHPGVILENKEKNETLFKFV